MNDADESTRLTRRGEEPEDGTQLVRRRRRQPAPAESPAPADDTVIVAREPGAPAADDTALVPRPSPSEPHDDTILVPRSAPAPVPDAAADPSDADEPFDATMLVRRETSPPSSESPVPTTPDEPEDATMLVQRAAPVADATVVVERDPDPAAALPHVDEVTVLRPRGVPTDDAEQPADDTVLRPRAPEDATLLRRRDRSAPVDGGDADDTVLGARATDLDDATRMSERDAVASPDAPRLTRPRRGGGGQTTSFAPDAQTDRTPARERYAIRTPTIGATPEQSAPASVVDVGDGGLAARTARRKTVRARLTVLAGVSALVFVGSVAGLVTLLSI